MVSRLRHAFASTDSLGHDPCDKQRGPPAVKCWRCAGNGKQCQPLSGAGVIVRFNLFFDTAQARRELASTAETADPQQHAVEMEEADKAVKAERTAFIKVLRAHQHQPVSTFGPQTTPHRQRAAGSVAAGTSLPSAVEVQNQQLVVQLLDSLVQQASRIAAALERAFPVSFLRVAGALQPLLTSTGACGGRRDAG